MPAQVSIDVTQPARTVYLREALRTRRPSGARHSFRRSRRMTKQSPLTRDTCAVRRLLRAWRLDFTVARNDPFSNALAHCGGNVYNTTKSAKAMMGTSKLIHAGSEPGYGESRVSQMGRKSSRSRELKSQRK